MLIELVHTKTQINVTLKTEGNEVEKLYLPTFEGVMSSPVKRILDSYGIGRYGHVLDLENGDTNYNIRYAVENCEQLIDYEIINIEPIEEIESIPLPEEVQD